MAPPGIPKTTSTPAASSEETKERAPVIFIGRPSACEPGPASRMSSPHFALAVVSSLHLVGVAGQHERRPLERGLGSVAPLGIHHLGALDRAGKRRVLALEVMLEPPLLFRIADVEIDVTGRLPLDRAHVTA